MWAHLILVSVLGFVQVRQIDVEAPSLTPAAYQLEGYLDKAPEGQTVQYKMVIGYGSKNRTYLITKSQVEGGGDPFAMYNNLGMFKPDYILVGPDKPLEALVTAKEGSRVSGTFFYRRGLNTLEVDPKSLKVE